MHVYMRDTNSKIRVVRCVEVADLSIGPHLVARIVLHIDLSQAFLELREVPERWARVDVRVYIHIIIWN